MPQPPLNADLSMSNALKSMIQPLYASLNAVVMQGVVVTYGGNSETFPLKDLKAINEESCRGYVRAYLPVYRGTRHEPSIFNIDVACKLHDDTYGSVSSKMVDEVIRVYEQPCVFYDFSESQKNDTGQVIPVVFKDATELLGHEVFGGYRMTFSAHIPRCSSRY